MKMRKRMAWVLGLLLLLAAGQRGGGRTMTGVIFRPKKKIEFGAITNAVRIYRRKTKNTCAKNGTAGNGYRRTSATG